MFMKGIKSKNEMLTLTTMKFGFQDQLFMKNQEKIYRVL